MYEIKTSVPCRGTPLNSKQASLAGHKTYRHAKERKLLLLKNTEGCIFRLINTGFRIGCQLVHQRTQNCICPLVSGTCSQSILYLKVRDF